MLYDRKETPKEVKALNDWEERSVLHVYHEEKMIMLFSYIDEQNSGEKNVIVLSNMHENVKVTKDQRKKAEVHIQSHKRGSWCCWFVVKESFYKGKIKEMALVLLPLLSTHAGQMQRPSLGTTTSSSPTLNSSATLEKLWYSFRLNDDTATQMNCESELSTRCYVFLVLRKFNGSNPKNPTI